jgi:hypothetical protein
MKTMNVIKLVMLLAGASILPAAYGQGVNIGINLPAPPVVVYPDVAPPAPLVETQPVSPGSDYLWINGSWVWGSNHKWEWEKGRWDRAPHEGMHYTPHHYEQRDGKHVFQRGGWK